MMQITAYISKEPFGSANSNVRIALLPVTAIPSYGQVSLSDAVTVGSGDDAKHYIFTIQYSYGSTRWLDADNQERVLPAATVTLQLTRGIAAWLLARMFQHLPGQRANMQNLYDILSHGDARSAIADGDVSIAGSSAMRGTLGLSIDESQNPPRYIGLVEVSDALNQIGFLTDDAVQHYYDRFDVTPEARADADNDGATLTSAHVLQAFVRWADAFAGRTAYFTKYFPVNVKDFGLSISQPHPEVDNLFASAAYVITAKAILPNGETQESSIDPRFALMRILDAFVYPFNPLGSRTYVAHNHFALFQEANALRGHRIGFVDGNTITYANMSSDFAADSDSAYTDFAASCESYFKEAGSGDQFKPVDYCYSDTGHFSLAGNSPLGQALTLLAPQHSDVWAQFIVACEVAFEAFWTSETRTGGSTMDLAPVLDAITAEAAYLDAQASARATTAINAMSDAETRLGGAIATAQDNIDNRVAESVATLIATISALDFDQTPTIGLANLIQSQNRVTQALVLALLRKSSSRAWFTSLIDKIGDANALLIDDTDIASIAEKAYRGDAVSNDEIHATPREAYKELFNDRGVNNG